MFILHAYEESVLKFMDANVRFVGLVLRRFMVKLGKD